MDWKIALAEPEIGAEEIEAVTKVLRDRWLSMGAVTEEFEARFAERMGVRHAIAVANCTAALHLAYLAVGIGPRDEVICPALTFVATANAARYTGASVVFADVVSETELSIDPADVAAKVTGRTRAITVVHYAGFACLMDEILDLARRNNLKVIEDCAHAPFARHRCGDGTIGQVGALGDVGCFSFFGNKNITTGEGGMVTTNDPEIARKVRLLRSHGMTSMSYQRHQAGTTGYDVTEIGYNYRIDEIRSAIGLCQLGKVEAINRARREVYRWYAELFADLDDVVIPFRHRDLELASCHIMPVILRGDYRATQARLREARVQTSKHYDLIPTFTAYRDHPFRSRVETLGNILTLPLHHRMTRQDVAYIRKVMGADLR